jgi:putative hydrolase of the HAD superfamily
MNKKICLIWDFDNTLAYRDGMWTRSLCNVLENNNILNYNQSIISDHFKTGLPWHRSDLLHKDYFNGLEWWDFVFIHVKNAFRKMGINDELRLSGLAEEFREEYLRKEAWFLYEDTVRNLEKSKNLGYANIILSNHTPELSELVRYLNIESYFLTVISSALIGADKPNPLIFNEIYRYGSFDKYYMIGDNYEADVIGAKNAGFEAILVRKSNDMSYGFYSSDLDEIWAYIGI